MESIYKALISVLWMVFVLLLWTLTACSAQQQHLEYGPTPDTWQKDTLQHAIVKNMTSGEEGNLLCSHYCTQRDDRFG